jgi:histidinol-phosphatase (PHP family)
MTAVIDAAARNGCVVEVNTGGLARGKEVLYPEPWIVEELNTRNVRMMVNTDAHAPDHLGFGYDRAFDLLRDGGYTEHWLLTDEGWRVFPV